MAPLIEIFECVRSSPLNKKAELLLKAVNHFLSSSSKALARPEATRPEANLIHAELNAGSISCVRIRAAA